MALVQNVLFWIQYSWNVLIQQDMKKQAEKRVERDYWQQEKMSVASVFEVREALVHDHCWKQTGFEKVGGNELEE